MNPDAPSQSLVAGKYELLHLIGRGGMGSVWEGRHTSLGTKVAIKFIEKEYADNDEARKRFDNEARAAATLQSKHAIQIYDHGVTEDGKPYIVMELLVGEPLDKRLDRMRVLSLVDTTHILQQVCRGLQKAHDHGIVHRDLKPENIFLVRSEDDDEEIAKVLDFGIAKIRTGGADQAVSHNTRTGAVLGTPFYMSPEQARGLRDIDHRTDLWSLGVIAFRCTTGRLPFEGESLGDLLVKICTMPVPLPSSFQPQLTPSFDAWFTRALDRDPNRRFASATEFADALAFAAGLSVKPRQAASSLNPNVGPPMGAGTAMGASSPAPWGGAPYTAPPASPYGPPAGYPMNVTSPPFVAASNPPTAAAAGGSKGWIVFAVIAMLVGLGLGGYSVRRMLAAKDQSTTVAAPSKTTEVPTAVTMTPLTTIAMTTNATAPSPTVPPPPHPTTNAGGGSHPTGHASTAPSATAVTTAPVTTSVTTTGPAVTYVPVPTTHPTATATQRPGEFGAGF